MTQSVSEQLSQLGDARQLVLADAALYPQIIAGVLPIIGVNALLDLRRWGADFLAETFASVAVTSLQKRQMSIVVLQTMRELLEKQDQDPAVVKDIVQAAAGLYGHVFHHVVENPTDTATWQKMVAIKSSIFRRWDTAPMGVRMCCIKFAQQVVQAQTMGTVADPRRPEQNDASLALVAKDHPLIPPSHLGAEASALLDRMLDVFNDKDSPPVLVNSTLSCLNVLIRTRPASVSDKIVATILNFNPIQYKTGAPLTPTLRIQIKSMERILRALLTSFFRRNETGPFAMRIRQRMERISQMCNERLNEAKRKRGPPPAEPSAEPSDGLDPTKRQRLGAELPAAPVPPVIPAAPAPPAPPPPPPLPEGPVSAAQLFTLTRDQDLTSFDVQQLPFDLMVKIFVPVLQHIDQDSFNTAVGQVGTRYQQLLERQQSGPPNVAPCPGPAKGGVDYEPDFEPEEHAGQTVNQSAGPSSAQAAMESPTNLALGTFKLPQPPLLTPEEIEEIGKSSINRVFGMMHVLDNPPAQKQKLGFDRLAGSNLDKDAWTTVIARLATRSVAGLQGSDGSDPNGESEDRKLSRIPKQNFSLDDGIRETLRTHILEDFRSRISVAVSWLTEEWYNDTVQRLPPGGMPAPFTKPGLSSSTLTPSNAPKHYHTWALRLLDGMLPYLDAKDSKHLIRFVGELPDVDRDILDRIKSLAKDPERVKLSVDVMHYLVLLRPPTKEIALDCLEELWAEVDDAKAFITKILHRNRPGSIPLEAPTVPNPQTTPAPGIRPPSGVPLAMPVMSPNGVTSGAGSLVNGIAGGGIAGDVRRGSHGNNREGVTHPAEHSNGFRQQREGGRKHRSKSRRHKR